VNINKIKIVIADDSIFSLESFTTLRSTFFDCEIVLTANNDEELLNRLTTIFVGIVF